MANNHSVDVLSRRVELSIECFRELRDLIYERSGIFFPENKRYLLESRLLHRLKQLEMSSFDEYVDYVKWGSDKRRELTRIFNSVTINETYFFRFERQLNVFSQKLLPDLVRRKKIEGKRELRIWSAGCSSGEEVYTIAMILMETLKGNLSFWRIELFGTDISEKILLQAKGGVYGANSFRGSMNRYYRTKYFSENGQQSMVSDDLRRLVKFDHLNLNDTAKIRMMRGIDIIFCRNVLIYFDEAMKKRVVRTFYDILTHGGYLFLGEAESVHGISSSFKVEHFPGAFVYKKE